MIDLRAKYEFAKALGVILGGMYGICLLFLFLVTLLFSPDGGCKPVLGESPMKRGEVLLLPATFPGCHIHRFLSEEI